LTLEGVMGDEWKIRMLVFKISVYILRAKSKALTLHVGFRGRSQCF
jgi:hypothetical protein